MRNLLITTILVSAISTYPLTPLLAQDTASSSETEATDETQAEDSEFAGLTGEELDELVAPVALYPDTLLIQILVATTYPLDVIKAQRFLEDNEGLEQEALTKAVEEQSWDPSVQVLATAFPDVLNRMADNVDWTETTGDAMLAQYDDVMASVQRMREAAIDAGSLVDTEEQEITRDETEAVVIVPSDPEVIYVPTYDTNTVYHDNNDALIFFSTVILIGVIYHNNNYWNGYWGCRNCGGYNGRPINYRPGNININGDVNIGNNVGNNWKPEPRREARAKDNLRERPNAGGGKVPALKDKSSRGDALRKDLGKKTGAKDISRPANKPSAAQAKAAIKPAKSKAAKRTAAPKKKITANKSRAKPAARPKTQQRKAKPSSFHRQQHGGGARKSSARASRNRGGGRRR